jgi:hypothetical protein
MIYRWFPAFILARATQGSHIVTKGLFVFSMLATLSVNVPNFVKTPNTISIARTLIHRNIEISTVPLTFCIAMVQIEF